MIQVPDQLLLVQALSCGGFLGLVERRESDAVGLGKCIGNFALEDVSAACGGTRLINSPQPLGMKGLAQSLERFANGGGVMCKILVYGDSVDFSELLQAP